MVATIRRLAVLAAVGLGVMAPRALSAQVAMFQTCTPVLSNCALIRLTNETGAGAGGSNLFEIAIQNQGTALMDPTSIYYLVLLTGLAPATENDAAPAPTAEGGATVAAGALPWSLAETGDLIILSSTDNSGIGGCSAGSAGALFPQVGQTCGTNQFITFSFSTQQLFDPTAFTIGDFELASATSADGNPTDGCGAFGPECVTKRVTVTPEPTTMLLSLTGFAGIAGVGLRRRSSKATHASTSEA